MSCWNVLVYYSSRHFGVNLAMRLSVFWLLLLAATSPVMAAEEFVFAKAGAPPKSWMQDGMPTGYVVEISDAVMRKAGIPAEVRLVPWGHALELAERENRIVTGLAMNAERSRVLLYSDPVYDNIISLVMVRGREFHFTGLSDLRGRAIGMEVGVSYGDDFETAIARSTVERDLGGEERLRKLMHGTTDAAIFAGGKTAVRYFAKRTGIDPSLLVVAPVPVAIDPNYIAIGRSRADGDAIIAKINQAIAELKADGTIARIMERYE